MPDGIKLGSCLFTLVDPHRGHEDAYNRWYERDHFYAGMMVMPHVFAGRRWYADDRLRAHWSGLDRGTFLATYWIEDEHHADFLRAAVAALGDLREQGRMFEHRDHVHTGFYELLSWGEREAGGTPPELALDHPFPGLVASLGGDEPEPNGAAALRVTFEPLPTPGFETGSEAVHLLFLDADPADCLDDWQPTVTGATWSACFVPTIPGLI